MADIIYLSPTGNTEYVAKELKKILEQKQKLNIVDFNKMNKNIPIKSKHLIIMYSIHAFNAPTVIIKYLKSLNEKNDIKSISYIAVGCNTTFLNKAVNNCVIKIANKKGIKIKLNRIIAMPPNLVKEISKEQAKEIIKKANNQIQEIGKDILEDKTDEIKIPFKSRIITKVASVEKIATPLFGIDLKANNNCISCGICWENCPTQNIYKSKIGKPKFRFKCMMCLGCIYRCPKKAISPRINKFMIIKNGYNVRNYLK